MTGAAAATGQPSVVNGACRARQQTDRTADGHLDDAIQIDDDGTKFSGFVSRALSGQVDFLVNASSALYLEFKFGGGKNSPYFFVYRLTGVNAGESITWTLNQTTVNTVQRPVGHPPLRQHDHEQHVH